jgi:hypothetical protein
VQGYWELFCELDDRVGIVAVDDVDRSQGRARLACRSHTSLGFAGHSLSKAGMSMLPSTIAMLVVGSQTGRLDRRLGSKPPPLAGGLASLATFALLSPAHTEQWEIYAAMLLLGSGIGLAFAAMADRIIQKVGPGETGVATGMHTVM